MKSKLSLWKTSLIVFAAWTIFALILAGFSYLASLGEERSASVWRIFSGILIIFYTWAIMTPLIYQVVRYLDVKRLKSVFRSVLFHFPSGLIFTFINSILAAAVFWLTNDSYHERFPTFYDFFASFLSGNLFLGIIIYALVVITAQALLFFRSYQIGEERNAELKSALAGAQLQALKMQLQPHFLFNTLHSIASLNLSNPQKANQMIARLGDFLRMTLEHSEDQMVTLDEELNFLRHYLEIEQIRFSDRLQVDFRIASDALSTEIPHLILQPIVENAVKHGIAPFAEAGKITIEAEKERNFLLIKVADKVFGNKSYATVGINASNGKGLQNVRERLEQIYEKDFDCRLVPESNGSGHSTILKIPILERAE